MAIIFGILKCGCFTTLDLGSGGDGVLLAAEGVFWHPITPPPAYVPELGSSGFGRV